MLLFSFLISQFNYSSGQPAPETITDKIYGNTLSVCSQSFISCFPCFRDMSYCLLHLFCAKGIDFLIIFSRLSLCSCISCDSFIWWNVSSWSNSTSPQERRGERDRWGWGSVIWNCGKYKKDGIGRLKQSEKLKKVQMIVLLLLWWK